MRKIINRFRQIFFKSLDEKPSWGREEIKNLFMLSLTNALLGKTVDEDEGSDGDTV